jgi:hypothetical protein
MRRVVNCCLRWGRKYSVVKVTTKLGCILIILGSYFGPAWRRSEHKEIENWWIMNEAIYATFSTTNQKYYNVTKKAEIIFRLKLSFDPLFCLIHNFCLTIFKSTLQF